MPTAMLLFFALIFYLEMVHSKLLTDAQAFFLERHSPRLYRAIVKVFPRRKALLARGRFFAGLVGFMVCIVLATIFAVYGSRQR